MKKTIIAMMMATAVIFSCEKPVEPGQEQTKPENECPDCGQDPCVCPPESGETIYVSFEENSYTKGDNNNEKNQAQNTVNVPVVVKLSATSETAPVLRVVADENYLTTFDATLTALPAACYTVSAEPVVEGLDATFTLTMNVAEIVSYAVENDLDFEELQDCVVALKLEATGAEVKMQGEESLGYYIAAPDVNAVVATVTALSASNKSATLKVELPFAPESDFEFELSGDVTAVCGPVDTERGNTIAGKYSCTPAPKDFMQLLTTDKDLKIAAGQTSLEFTVSAPASFEREWTKGATNNFAVTVKGQLGGVDIDVNGYSFLASYPANHVTIKHKIEQTDLEPDEGCTDPNPEWFGTKLSEAPYNMTLLNDGGGARQSTFGFENMLYEDRPTAFIFHPQSSQDSWYDRVFNNTLRAWPWEAKWSGSDSNYGESALPYWILIDMRSAQKISGIEWWRRPDQFVTDVRSMEFYALDACTYELNKSVLNYESDAATYLGNLDFADGNENCAYVTIDPIETQYLVILITAQNRSAIDCMELNIWGE